MVFIPTTTKMVMISRLQACPYYQKYPSLVYERMIPVSVSRVSDDFNFRKNNYKPKKRKVIKV